MTEYTTIHRYLDEAFAGIEMNGEIQDLKEEIRGNLTARVAELESTGLDAATAASTAIRELGDIRDLVDSIGVQGEPETLTQLVERNKVRQKPGFVVRTTALSLLLAAGLLTVTLAVFGVVSITVGLVAAAGIALALGVIVGDSLRQETTQHYPLPRARAIGFGAASGIGGLGLALAALFLVASDWWMLIVGGLLVLASIIGFTWLGVTQTNRTKPWALAMQRSAAAEDRFTQDPAAAARFGLYTVVIWVLAIVLFIVLSFTVGFAWSWLAIIGGFVAFFLVLSQMLFGEHKK